MSVEEFEREITQLRTELRWRSIERELLLQLIRTNTSIPIDDVIRRGEQEINLYNYPDGMIPVIIHDAILACKNEKHTRKTLKIKDTSSTIPKKKIFRTLVRKNSVSDSASNSSEPHNNGIDLDIPKPVLTSAEIQYEKSRLVEAIEKDRIYSKSLERLGVLRTQYVIACSKSLTLAEYIGLLNSDISQVQQILETTKELKGKKLKTSIATAMSNLDQHLLMFNEYHNTSLSSDECHIAKILYKNQVNVENLVPLNKEVLFSKFDTYCVAIFPIVSMVETVMCQPLDKCNIIFSQTDKTNSKDPHSFFYLETLENGISKWSLDGRLENICADLIEHLTTYMTSLFRRIYQDFFKDNEYRSDFKTKAPIMGEDMEQLLQNIYQIAFPIKFTNKVRSIVKDYCQVDISNSETNKVNIWSDDAHQRKHFTKNVESNNIPVICKLLFDNVLSETDVKNLFEIP